MRGRWPAGKLILAGFTVISTAKPWWRDGRSTAPVTLGRAGAATVRTPTLPARTPRGSWSVSSRNICAEGARRSRRRFAKTKRGDFVPAVQERRPVFVVAEADHARGWIGRILFQRINCAVIIFLAVPVQSTKNRN